MNEAEQFETAEILGVPLVCCSIGNILDTMDRYIKNGISGYIGITNSESVYHAQSDPFHRNYLKKAAFSCCDGVAVALAGRLMGYRIPRIHGPDLMLKCCEYGIDKNWKHFFYGGKQGVPELLDRELKKKHAGLHTVGAFSPPFRPLTDEEDRRVVDMINRAQPDIVWVGLGLLKQERWIADHLGKIEVPWMIGVGAAFDFHAGIIKRAPRFYRRIGLEWLYRLAFEPRMFIRNIYSFIFFYYVIRDTFYRRFEQKRNNNGE